MQLATVPENDQDRLKALYRYNILDTEEEQEFDDLAYMASYICQTPIAVITMVDENRQWFKSKIGLDVAETPRDIGFCSHVIHQKDLFIVPDTMEDERFHDNPIVLGAPHVRFYAGSPLITPDGHVIGSLCTIDNKPRELTSEQMTSLRSLSRQVISQMELRAHMKNLRQANQQLLDNQDLLKEANRHKTYFLSNMSHEIRTPLNAILGFSQLLLFDATKYNLPHHVKTLLGNIEKSSKHLLGVISGVLEISKIEANQIEVSYSEINLNGLVDSVYQMYLIKAKDVNINFSYSYEGKLPKVFTSDKTKLSQILINLVGNAIKFTPDGGKVTLDVNVENNHIVFHVTDTGVGIEKSNQRLIFEPFEQVEFSNSRSYEGTGLGLSITKSLVEFLDGRIQVQSQLNEGATFSVSIPFIESTTDFWKDNAQIDDINFSNSQKKVLIVEDNPQNQIMMSSFFERIDLNFKLAENGNQAIEYARSYKPDLILMDIHLPGINGIEATKKISNSPECAHIPIVALTADAGIEQGNKASDAGFKDYLTKPLKFRVLTKTLQKYLG
ncbi:MAG: ATP-binding protein [Porticoccus sp.]|nr:ATP-binding protein [Porticoccus sp.]